MGGEADLEPEDEPGVEGDEACVDGGRDDEGVDDGVEEEEEEDDGAADMVLVAEAGDACMRCEGISGVRWRRG
jgi:hypothetical protein